MRIIDEHLHGNGDGLWYDLNGELQLVQVDAYLRLKERSTAAEALLAALVDDEPCDLDHHGSCQTHNWFSDKECGHARAKAFLDGEATP